MAQGPTTWILTGSPGDVFEDRTPVRRAKPGLLLDRLRAAAGVLA